MGRMMGNNKTHIKNNNQRSQNLLHPNQIIVRHRRSRETQRKNIMEKRKRFMLRIK
jgi:hypothetical protein